MQIKTILDLHVRSLISSTLSSHRLLKVFFPFLRAWLLCLLWFYTVLRHSIEKCSLFKKKKTSTWQDMLKWMSLVCSLSNLSASIVYVLTPYNCINNYAYKAKTLPVQWAISFSLRILSAKYRGNLHFKVAQYIRHIYNWLISD